MSAVVERHEDGRLVFHCPGCHCSHGVFVDRAEHPVWGWNGSMEKPTFTLSILVTMGRGHKAPAICHSFVTDGRIQFLSDCTHALAGQTIDLTPDE